MSKSSGGTKNGGTKPPKPLKGDAKKNVKIKNIETLKNIEDRKTYSAVGDAIGRFHSVLGVREKNVKLADLSSGVMGVQITTAGKSEGIYLSKSYFKKAKPEELTKSMKDMYAQGWQTKTNKPIAHVVTHELAHATWNSHLTNQNAVAAGSDVRKLYNEWRRDKNIDKLGYGKYSHTNINEFWAETATKAVHGVEDKYTRGVKDIIKKHKL